MDKDTRNVIDYYKSWETDAIRGDLDTKRHNFSVVCCNIQGDFNISSTIRNSNAFLAKEVIIYGRKNFDRRGCVGTQNYTNFKHVREIDDLDSLLKNEYKNSLIIGIDNVECSLPIETFDWPKDKHIVLIFGEEQTGIPDNVKSLCEKMLFVKQYGSVRSLNVSVASGVCMFSLCSKLY